MVVRLFLILTHACTDHYHRSSYYNADTTDLEIGQEFEDAEAEEEAALELQRATYKRLDPSDYGEEDGKQKEQGTEQRETKGKGKAGQRGGATAQEAALLAMKSDLEQIALGAAGEVIWFRLVVALRVGCDTCMCCMGGTLA